MSRIDPDAALVQALRRGDPEATDQLVARYADGVYRLARTLTGSAEDAEEATQDALWAAVRKLATFKAESAFGTWIYRIACNAAYQLLRRRRRSLDNAMLNDVLPALASDGHFTPMDDWSNRVDDGALQSELRRVLTEAIEALPPDYRVPLILHDVEAVSNPEIGQTLGISVSAAKSRVHRARLFLRKRLSEYLEAA